MPITDAKLRALKPRERAYKVADFEGLYVTVNPKGSRLWHWKYRIAGREKRLAFGPYPIVSLAEARRLRDEARGLLANGIDPGEEKKERKLRGGSRNLNSWDRWIFRATAA